MLNPASPEDSIGQVCLLLSGCISSRVLSSEKSKFAIPFLYPPAGYHDNAYCAGKEQLCRLRQDGKCSKDRYCATLGPLWICANGEQQSKSALI